MASLDFQNRWFPYTPQWLDNRKSAAPFQVRIRRLTAAELDAFNARVQDTLGKRTVTAEELGALFDGVVEGPVGSLEINGEDVVDLAGLLRFAAMESPWSGGSLADELAVRVVVENTLSKDAAGN